MGLAGRTMKMKSGPLYHGRPVRMLRNAAQSLD